MATSEPDTGELSPQKSTEDVCREAAQKLNEYHTASCTREEKQQDNNELKRETTSNPPRYGDSSATLPCALEEPPPYTAVTIVNTPVQIPLADRGDGTLSFHVPPPPPPSPGDALDKNPGTPRLPPYYNYQLPVTYPYQTSIPQQMGPYTVIAAPPPQIVCIQAQSQSTPTHAIPQGNTDINQNVNNVNVVVENNIGWRKLYPSYICFSMTLLLLCAWLNPMALFCIIPAVIFSCVGCCTSRYRVSKVAGQCALCCNIIALVFGITAFVLLIAPAIVVSLMVTVFAVSV